MKTRRKARIDQRQLELQLPYASVRHFKPGARLLSLGFIAMLWCGLLVGRLWYLQLSPYSHWQSWAGRQHNSMLQLSAERGAIIDRRGRSLALSVPASSLYVRPKAVSDRKGVAHALAQTLRLDERQVMQRLSENKPFVWIDRQVPRSMADQVMELKLPGVGVLEEAKRLYPFSEAGSSLVGRSGMDGEGLSGIELVYDKVLQGKGHKVAVSKDALGNIIDVSDRNADARDGSEVQLTIDAGLQVIADEELEAGRVGAGAKRALAVLVDADTGDVLSLSQAPSVNFNAQLLRGESLTNFAVEATFEPGSMMKPLVAGLALQAGVARTTDMINCENGKYRFAGKTINDVHPSGIVSLRDVIVRSSNIGMTKIGSRLGAERLYSGLRLLGFGQSSHLGLPGETAGILRPLDSWSGVDVATHSFGQGVAVTPMQIVRAVSAVANGGLMPQLHVVARDRDESEPVRIFSPQVSAQVRDMMYGVIEEEHGTGHNAAIEGVRVGGKTGTAQKAREDGRGYAAGKYVAGFVGFVDASSVGIAQRLALIVVVDEPAGAIYGGAVAAPIFKRIMQRVLHNLTLEQHLGGVDEPSQFTPVRAKLSNVASSPQKTL